MDVKAQANDIYLTLTRREYTLVTKALKGVLNPEPCERLEHDDIPDAKALGDALMERRLLAAEQEAEAAQKAIDNYLSWGGE